MGNSPPASMYYDDDIAKPMMNSGSEKWPYEPVGINEKGHLYPTKGTKCLVSSTTTINSFQYISVATGNPYLVYIYTVHFHSRVIITTN